MDKGNWVLKILASDKNINFTSRANPYASMADRPGYVIALSSIRRNETSPLRRPSKPDYCQASSGLISVNAMMSSKSPCIRKISELSTNVS